MIIEQGDGYWVKFEVKRIDNPTMERPHGIRYSLTLHAPNGLRILGFDNAHAVRKSHIEYDHKHRHQTDSGIPYKFVDAYKLIKDFWKAVDEALLIHKKGKALCSEKLS